MSWVKLQQAGGWKGETREVIRHGRQDDQRKAAHALPSACGDTEWLPGGSSRDYLGTQAGAPTPGAVFLLPRELSTVARLSPKEQTLLTDPHLPHPLYP